MNHTTRFLSTALLFSCAGEAPPDPPPTPDAMLYARVQLDGSGLHIAHIDPRGTITNFATPGSTALDYQLLDATGRIVAAGELADPRRAHFEAFDGAVPEWLEANVGSGATTIALPSYAGTLVVSAGSTELGRTSYDPSVPLPAPLVALPGDVTATVEVVAHGPAAGHLNLAILAEGYTEDQLPQFDQAVDNLVAELGATDGFEEHWSQINIWRIDVRSRQAGAGTGGVANDTAFDTAYDTAGIHRLLAMESQGARDAAKQLRESVAADAAIIMVNSTDYGGSGDGANVESVIYAGDGGDGRGIASIAAHELGHSIWKLADEYEDADLCGPAASPAPNIALSLASLPWASLVAPTTPLPTTSDDPDLVGAFEGAAYCATGRYRAQLGCRMRSLDHGYCAVCRSQIDDYFENLAGTSIGPGTGPTCGNGICEAGETCTSCPRDCSATCAVAPAPPASLSPDNGVTVAYPVTLSWSGVPGATSYWVLLGHWDASSTWIQDGYWNNGDATSETFADVAGTSYEFSVSACTADLCGDWSSWAGFVGD